MIRTHHDDGMKMTTYTAWLTTDRSCLTTDYCDVVVLANDDGGSSTGDPIWSATTTTLYTPADRDDDALISEAKALLTDGGWTTTGDWEDVPTGYIINVDQEG